MTDSELKALVSHLAVTQAQMQSQQAQMDTEWRQQMKEMNADWQQQKKEMKEMDAKWRQQKMEMDAEWRQQMKEMSAKGQKEIEKLEALHAETEVLLQKTIKENDKRYKELNRQIGGLGNKFGSFTEGMAFSSLRNLLRKRFGMTVIATRVKAARQDKKLELDVLAYSNNELNTAFIVEIKSHARQEDLQQMLTTLATFPDVFPEHAGKQLYGILAAVDIPDNLKDQVLKKGIYLAKINDELFKLRVPKHFQAQNFSQNGFESG